MDSKDRVSGNELKQRFQRITVKPYEKSRLVYNSIVGPIVDPFRGDLK